MDFSQDRLHNDNDNDDNNDEWQAFLDLVLSHWLNIFRAKARHSSKNRNVALAQTLSWSGTSPVQIQFNNRLGNTVSIFLCCLFVVYLVTLSAAEPTHL